MGTYEQDDVASNGKENIEWFVLEKNDDKLLLISRYSLARMAFGEFPDTWEDCPLRNWLNNEFLNEAFHDQEKGLISANADISTNDKVFLLSSEEIAYYWNLESLRQCRPTEAAGRYSHDKEAYCWWTRSNTVGCSIVIVLEDGTIWAKGTRIDGENLGVRPALWIDLGK